MRTPNWEDIKGKLDHVVDAARGVLYGMTVYEWIREINKSRGELERVFILIVFGELLGVPILPPYYTLRLLPYIVPRLETWRYSMLRERDLTDLFDQEIG
ncbi:MAG: hypothetical protein PVG71_02860 [Anaerolineae bacterium]|jgi:hypothetical protein